MVQRAANIDRAAVRVTVLAATADCITSIGYLHWINAIPTAALDELLPLFDALDGGRAGERAPLSEIAPLAAARIVTERVAKILGPATRPVRALLFDKRADGNWALGWHQDRTIEVSELSETDGFGPWTMKAGRPHVAPPIEILQRMITARIHLDPVDRANAPLLVVSGSHRHGLIPERTIEAVVAADGEYVCLAEAGDVWLYATLILHASKAAVEPRHRRVLQIDFSADALPGGLEWAAIA